jgi:hypothetical protein
MHIWNRDVVNVMGPTFELDYTEKYHTLLLASRIISDALKALLPVRSGRRAHPEVGDVLKKINEEVYKHLSDYLVNLAEKLHPLIPLYAALTS